MILYSPFSSVTVVRLFSIRAGLDASTVTPGSTAPEVSLALPAMVPVPVPCALNMAGRSHSAPHTRMVSNTSRLMEWPPQQTVDTTLFGLNRDPRFSENRQLDQP